MKTSLIFIIASLFCTAAHAGFDPSLHEVVLAKRLGLASVKALGGRIGETWRKLGSAEVFEAKLSAVEARVRDRAQFYRHLGKGVSGFASKTSAADFSVALDELLKISGDTSLDWLVAKSLSALASIERGELLKTKKALEQELHYTAAQVLEYLFSDPIGFLAFRADRLHAGVGVLESAGLLLENIVAIGLDHPDRITDINTKTFTRKLNVLAPYLPRADRASFFLKNLKSFNEISLEKLEDNIELLKAEGLTITQIAERIQKNFFGFMIFNRRNYEAVQTELKSLGVPRSALAKHLGGDLLAVAKIRPSGVQVVREYLKQIAVTEKALGILLEKKPRLFLDFDEESCERILLGI